MNVDGFYFWHCDVCGESVPESPNESEPWGYGNMLLVEINQKVKQVCRDCISDLGDRVCGGISYAGPRARQWANEINN